MSDDPWGEDEDMEEMGDEQFETDKMGGMAMTSMIMMMKHMADVANRMVMGTNLNPQSLLDLKPVAVRECCDEDIGILLSMAKLGYWTIANQSVENRLMKRLCEDASDEAKGSGIY